MRPFTSCKHTCSTDDPSFIIESCQVRFQVLIYNNSVTTYTALDEIPVHHLVLYNGVSQWVNYIVITNHAKAGMFVNQLPRLVGEKLVLNL